MDNQRYPDKFGARTALQRSFANPPATPSLSEEELTRVRDLSHLHVQLLPEFEPFLKELYRCGLIDGRRALICVQKLDVPATD